MHSGLIKPEVVGTDFALAAIVSLYDDTFRENRTCSICNCFFRITQRWNQICSSKRVTLVLSTTKTPTYDAALLMIGETLTSEIIHPIHEQISHSESAKIQSLLDLHKAQEICKKSRLHQPKHWLMFAVNLVWLKSWSKRSFCWKEVFRSLLKS